MDTTETLTEQNTNPFRVEVWLCCTILDENPRESAMQAGRPYYTRRCDDDATVFRTDNNLPVCQVGDLRPWETSR